MEAEPEAEAVGQRDLFLDRLAGIDRGRALVLDHVARQQMAPVRGRVEHDIVGPALDAAFEHRLQRFVAGVLLVEGEIVAEQEAAAGAAAQQREQARQARDVLAVDLDQRQRRPARASALIAACTALTSELLPMPRAPHSSTLLAGKPAAKRSVLSSRMSRTRSMPLQQVEIDAVDPLTGSSRRVGVPDEGVGCVKCWGAGTGAGGR